MKRVITSTKIPAMAGDLFVPMPAGADILSAGFVGVDLLVWFMADEKAPMDRVRLLVLPEDEPVNLPDGMDLSLIGRAEKESSILVPGPLNTLRIFHVFQIIKDAAA